MYGLSLNDAGIVSAAISDAKKIDFRTALSLSGMFEHADNLNRYNITYVIDDKYELVRQVRGAHFKMMTLSLYELSRGDNGDTTKRLMSEVGVPYSDCEFTQQSNSEFWRLSCIEQECINRLTQLYPNVVRRVCMPQVTEKHAFSDVFKKIFSFSKSR